MSMTEPPQLIIIAGPNGAGKSTVSSNFLNKGAILYDPDKESQSIFDKYPQLPTESIYYFINNHFQDKISKALRTQKDFILETNFRDYQIMDTVDQFKSKGYKANLMYFLLSSEKASLDRVTERVNDGGHFVDARSIRLNYTEGLKNLQYFAPRFDRVLLFDASPRLGELTPLLNIDAMKIKFIHDKIPAWAESTIQQLMATMLSNRETVKSNDSSSGLNR
jgi:predicted ABC-type ATPase